MKELKIYLLKRDEYIDYDSYDSVIVVAESEERAKLISPEGGLIGDSNSYGWTNKIENIKVTLIGAADKSLIEEGVVLASFNAG